MTRIMTGLLALMGLSVSVSAQSQMTLPGKFEVTDTGSASYTIPISIVPGTAGLEPKLSLQYDSRSGNGLLGVGWSLAGLPAITRCGRTIAQDGVAGGVSYDANDRFCLDGQRLIAISGTYGAEGTEYRTERESFSKVISYGSAGSGPSYFRVWTKAGLVMEFGNTADSKIEAQGKTSVRVWALNKTSDTKGNYFAVSYLKDTGSTGTGEYRPNRIDYTGNATAGTLLQNSVRFIYESRPDIVPMYQAGSLIKTTKRLKQIEAWQGDAPGTKIRVYIADYDSGTVTKRSQLTSLRQCAVPEICQPSTEFAYSGSSVFQLGFSRHANPIAPTALDSGAKLHFGDWNGDGIIDVMAYDSVSGSNDWFVNTGVVNGQLSFATYINPLAAGSVNQGGTFHVGDWNGDGLSDILHFRSDGTNNWYINNGIVNNLLSFAQYTTPISAGGLNQGMVLHFGDWDGDGRTDLLAHGADGGNAWYINNGVVNGQLNFTKYTNPILPGGLNQGMHLFWGDWNGDGRGDLLAYSTSGGNAWYVNNGVVNGQLNFTKSENPIASGNLNQGIVVYAVGDWNSDGLADIMAYAPNAGGGNGWYINNGAMSFTKFANALPYGSIQGGVLHFGDWNGDGINDTMFYLASGGTNDWYVSNGVNSGTLSFTAFNNTIATGYMNQGGTVYVGDFNGDGISDIVRHESGGGNGWYINTAQKPDLLQKIVSGLKSQSEIAYASLSQTGAPYARDSGASACAYPCTDVQGPLYVVSEVKSSNGIDATPYRSTYRYAGAKANQHGRGFLGFRQMTVRDEQTGVEQVTIYEQDYPLTGLVRERRKSHVPVVGGQATLLNRSLNHYGSYAMKPRVTFPFLKASAEESFELGGGTEALRRLPGVLTTYEYDGKPQTPDPDLIFGNVTKVTVETGVTDLSSGIPVLTSADGHSKATVNTYDNTTTGGAWLLGRLRRSEVTSTTPGN